MIMNRIKHSPAVTWFTATALLISMCASLTLSRRATAQSTGQASPGQSEARDNATADYPALTRYAKDLTRLAAQGKLERATGHNADIARVVDSLARATNKAPVVVGESDLERDAVARGGAFKIAFSDVPDSLRHKRVLSLSIDALAQDA